MQRVKTAEAKLHDVEESCRAQIEAAHKEHARDMALKVAEDAEVERLKTENANLTRQLAEIHTSLEAAAAGEGRGDGEGGAMVPAVDLIRVQQQVAVVEAAKAECEKQIASLRHEADVEAARANRADELHVADRLKLATVKDQLAHALNDLATCEANLKHSEERADQLEAQAKREAAQRSEAAEADRDAQHLKVSSGLPN